jgi:hypothetical protein
MSATELKSKIIEKISAIEDESVLREIFDLISLEAKVDSVYRLTEAEKNAIEIGLKDIANGEVYSSQVADQMLKEWLKK